MNPEEQNSETNKILIQYQKDEDDNLIKEEEEDITEKEQEFSFICKRPEISLRQEDTIKLIAQYVAINGEDFLIALTERKKYDSLFDFLQPSNPKFNYFTRLVDSYVKIIGFEKEDYIKLENNIKNKK